MEINIPEDLISFFRSLGFKTKDGIKDIFINCPYHKEEDPSLSVRKKDGIWNCFGCGESGSFIGLLDYLGVDYDKLESAVDALDLTNFREELDKYFFSKKRKYREYLKRFSFQHYPNLISIESNEVLYNYMRKRGFEDKTLGIFDIGYTDKKKNKGNKNEFFGRVLIPVEDEKGKVLWCEGRKITSGRNKKYIRPPFSPVSRQFFNYYRAKDQIEYVVLVEGVFDAMMMVQRGINSIANFGTRISEYKMNFLSYFSRVILCFDGDEAGKTSQIKYFKELKGRGYEVFQIHLTQGKDVCDYSLEEFNKKVRSKLLSICRVQNS